MNDIQLSNAASRRRNQRAKAVQKHARGHAYAIQTVLRVRSQRSKVIK